MQKKKTSKKNKSLILTENNPRSLKEKNKLFIGGWLLENLFINKKKIYKEDIFVSKSGYKKQKLANTLAANKIYNNILIDLSKELNRVHKKNISLRGWSIILGPWLINFTNICYERIFSISEVFHNYNIKKIYITQNEKFDFSTKDTLGLQYQAISDDWNSNLYFKIIKFLKIKTNLICKTSKSHGFQKSFYDYYGANYRSKFSFLKIKKFLSFLLLFFQKKEDGLIQESSLPLIYEKFFELSFFQFPQFRFLKEINYKKININLREQINIDTTNSNKENLNNKVEKFIRKILPKAIPVAMIESFDDIYTECDNIGYPKKPKFIFTSNSASWNEHFKFFTAKKIQDGTKYFVVQHGNSYFTHNISLNHHEINTSDFFITWGHSSKKNRNLIKGFNFKTIKNKKNKLSNGDLLVLVNPLNIRRNPYQSYDSWWLSSLKHILKFNKINPAILKNTTLRLTGDYKSKNMKYYVDKFFYILKKNIDYGKINYNYLISKSRLCVFTFDSTGILENLLLNKPTIAILENFHNDITPEYKKKYNLLFKAKIFFHNADEAIDHINKYWENIEDWWLSKSTQKKINQFNHNLNIKGDLKKLTNLVGVIKKRL